MLDALQALRYISAGLWPLLLQCLCLLLQDRQPHGDVYRKNSIMQRIFSPPPRRPPFECFPSVSRRDAELKILCILQFSAKCGIRARPDLRTNQSRPCIGPCARTQRRCALQNDSGKSPPRDGRHGTKGNESDGFMQRTGYYPANALPARRAKWDAAQGWAEGS